MPRTRNQTGLQAYDSTTQSTQRKLIAYMQSNIEPPMDNMPGANMVENTTTQQEALDRCDYAEPE